MNGAESSSDGTCPFCGETYLAEFNGKYFEYCPDCDTEKKRLEAKVNQLQTELAAYRWIPVGERLPENANAVILIWGDYFYIGCCREGEWYIDGELHTEVTHWMPIFLPS